MYKFLLLTLFIIVPSHIFSQEIGAAPMKDENTKVVDSLFREDQFYVALSYNLVQNSPTGFKQFSFSPSVSAGFLRDFPISKNKHWAIAPGIGYSYNNIKQFISTNDLFSDNPPNPAEEVKTKIVSHSIEIPLEIRWRNVSYDSHKFWRIYTGIKARYVLSTNLKLQSATIGSQSSNVIDNINKWQYGMYVSTGYNTWNIHAYYGLNPIFKNGSKLSDLNIGFMFYIL